MAEDGAPAPLAVIGADAAERPARWVGGLVSGAAWLAAAALVSWVPNVNDWDRTDQFAALVAALGGLFVVAGIFGPALGAIFARIRPLAPWLVVLAIVIAGWELVTAKLALLPPPFFAPPQALLDVYIDDWHRLGESALRSLWLLGTGYAIGAALGFV